MSLQDDLNSKVSWEQHEIDALKGKYSRIHQTHFGVNRSLDLPAVKDNGWEWVQVRPGRWVRRKKHQRVGDMPEVNDVIPVD